MTSDENSTFQSLTVSSGSLDRFTIETNISSLPKHDIGWLVGGDDKRSAIDSGQLV